MSRRRNLDVLIAWLDAARRRDREAMAALLAPAATWQGVRPEWRCRTPEEIVDMWVRRSAELDDLRSAELSADDERAVLRLRAPSLGRLDGALRGGVDIAFAIGEDGRIAGMVDAGRRGPGPFVVNAADAAWKGGVFGTFTPFEPEGEGFPMLGFNLAVLQPGQPACFYHREGDQEDFLVLRGEALLLVEGEERRLRAWDFFHCPPWTDHVLIGAGDGPCTLLAVGTRTRGGVVYPASGLARRHGAGAAEETTSPAEAYAGTPDDEPVAFDPGWLP
jgi:uncharacterized cupin superfamily protein